MQSHIFVKFSIVNVIFFSVVVICSSPFVKYETKPDRPISISIETIPPTKLIKAPNWITVSSFDSNGEQQEENNKAPTNGQPAVLVLSGVAKETGRWTFDVEDQIGTITVQIDVKHSSRRKIIPHRSRRKEFYNPATILTVPTPKKLVSGPKFPQEETQETDSKEYFDLDQKIQENNQEKMPSAALLLQSSNPTPPPPVNLNNPYDASNPLQLTMMSDDYEDSEPVKQPRRQKYFSRDYDDHEIYKISPKFQYRFKQNPVLRSTTTTSAPVIESEDFSAIPIHHQQLAAGVSFIALMLLLLVLCCLMPLVYYLCQPEFKKLKRFSLLEWLREHLAPDQDQKDNNNIPDFERDYSDHLEINQISELPEKRQRNEAKPVKKKHHKHKHHEKNSPQPGRTSLRIQLKENPIELSISEVEEEETEYLSDMDDIGDGKIKKRRKPRYQKKGRSKSAPTTPITPADKWKKRFSFGSTSSKSPSKQLPVASPKKAANLPVFTTEDDEDVIYNRYNGKPIDDVTKSRSTQHRLSNITPAENTTNANSTNDEEIEQDQDPEQYPDQNERNSPDNPLRKVYNRDQETSSSEEGNNRGRRPKDMNLKSNVGHKSPSEEYFENEMVPWPRK